jgi:hypothetical protein
MLGDADQQQEEPKIELSVPEAILAIIAKKQN